MNHKLPINTIQLKPFINQKVFCPYCSKILSDQKPIWTGIHVCVSGHCDACNIDFVQDLIIGHARYYPFGVDTTNWKLFGPENHSQKWFGQPLLESLKNPNSKDIALKVTKKIAVSYKNKKVIIINCIDFLYGHCLLKLFNCDQYKNDVNNYLIVIAPQSIEWLIPDYVAETWIVNIPIREAQEYYLKLEKKINQQLNRFSSFYLNKTNCHPRNVNVPDYVKCEPHNLESEELVISFYWREDRPWLSSKILDKFLAFNALKNFSFLVQAIKIILLFSKIKKAFPNAKFLLVGIGKQIKFPSWINDSRIAHFSQSKDKEMCKLYSKSKLIIGTLGSHMILPVALAGMKIEIMRDHSIGCLGQDVVITPQFQNFDPRLLSFIHRYMPIDVGIGSLSDTVISMLADYRYSKMYFSKQLRDK